MSRALALGADAWMVGRPQIPGLAVAGARGATHVIRPSRDACTSRSPCGVARRSPTSIRRRRPA
ncbi:MAG: alpha-hydroxy-acid oxidizing protein [Rhodocyclaceae bacterium]|nr:alpha-hydroxy-acid oxidizing protein [Rhodocyclaceae bacterium]